jgi:hypothetical protein
MPHGVRFGAKIWRHKIGGSTESDIVFAGKCDARFTPVIARAG